MIIKPTIGRVVWYWPTQGVRCESDQPRAALITYVHEDDLVNIISFTKYGVAVPIQKVLLVQEGVEHPVTGHFAQWMPYQVGQAKKHEPMVQQEIKL